MLIFVVRHYEKNRPSDWRIYAPIVNAPQFRDFINSDAGSYWYVEEDENGAYEAYGKKFTKMI